MLSTGMGLRFLLEVVDRQYHAGPIIHCVDEEHDAHVDQQEVVRPHGGHVMNY